MKCVMLGSDSEQACLARHHHLFMRYLSHNTLKPQGLLAPLRSSLCFDRLCELSALRGDDDEQGKSRYIYQAANHSKSRNEKKLRFL